MLFGYWDQVNELLPVKIKQFKILLNEHWIGIDRSKREPVNYKAFLLVNINQLCLKDKKDFDFLFLMKSGNSYIFTPETNSDKPLTRETLTRDINKAMKAVSEKIET